MRIRLLGRRELGDRLGTLGDGVLGQLTGEDETDGGLDLTRRDGGAVVVRSELGSLGGDTLEDVRDERVEDGHGLVRDTSVGVDLLEDLVDVRRVRLDPLLGALLATLGLGGGGLGGLSGSLGSTGGGLGGLGGGSLGSDRGLGSLGVSEWYMVMEGEGNLPL